MLGTVLYCTVCKAAIVNLLGRFERLCDVVLMLPLRSGINAREPKNGLNSHRLEDLNVGIATI